MSSGHDVLPATDAAPARGALSRRLHVAAGALLVAVGAIGIVVPGLPTTVFLIAASWCFSRSCPALTDRWLRRGIFAPYMRYADERRPMPAHARLIALLAMWAGTAMAVRAWDAPWAEAAIVVAAGIGSVAVLLVRRPTSSGCPVLGLVEVPPAARPARDTTIP